MREGKDSNNKWQLELATGVYGQFTWTPPAGTTGRLQPWFSWLQQGKVTVCLPKRKRYVYQCTGLLSDDSIMRRKRVSA